MDGGGGRSRKGTGQGEETAQAMETSSSGRWIEKSSAIKTSGGGESQTGQKRKKKKEVSMDWRARDRVIEENRFAISNEAEFRVPTDYKSSFSWFSSLRLKGASPLGLTWKTMKKKINRRDPRVVIEECRLDDRFAGFQFEYYGESKLVPSSLTPYRDRCPRKALGGELRANGPELKIYMPTACDNAGDVTESIKIHIV
ncbi:hypothetical protein ASPWEDRAFT_22924 [Aspergillus wentii DTO 134E9]|uniref:Uncharacterized protein n=1 Tax=Aspergillus wentii DTO 134E9 TaxID=1073089 RepID=A0A1L9S0T4_ASPWE|nr:uncharacterized protein ASPWEDRAFT_22924 [Aspergillus wentii DTO 134E9]OJJ40774.1 hypothetical protein ASPWEDRAFT_22924 [Aspergillus wentii DTO 134E9]